MLSKEEIRDYLVKNCRDGNGDLILNGLDFSDFNGDVYIGSMKVKQDLYQNHQRVDGHLYQSDQIVGRNLYQSRQQVDGYLEQSLQKVHNNLFQDGQKVDGMLYQDEIPHAVDDDTQKEETETVTNESRPDGTFSFAPEEMDKFNKFIQLLVEMKAEFKVYTDGYCYMVDYIENCKQDYKTFKLVDRD